MATKKVSIAKKTAAKKVIFKSKVLPKTVAKIIIKEKPIEVEVINPNIYPIGKYNRPVEFTEDLITMMVEDIRTFPKHLKKHDLNA